MNGVPKWKRQICHPLTEVPGCCLVQSLEAEAWQHLQLHSLLQGLLRKGLSRAESLWTQRLQSTIESDLPNRKEKETLGEKRLFGNLCF